jgi:excisionase family DNA binding protein
MEKLLVSVWPEAAEALGIGRSTAFELVASGQLASVRVGRRRLVPASALREFADRLVKAQAADTGGDNAS